MYLEVEFMKVNGVKANVAPVQAKKNDNVAHSKSQKTNPIVAHQDKNVGNKLNKLA
jgi:hypothetical protein